MTDISSALATDIQCMALSQDGLKALIVREKVSGESTVVQVSPAETVASLKAKLQDKIGVSPEYIAVFEAGSSRSLSNNATVTVEKELVFSYTLSGGGKKDAGKDAAAEVAGNEDAQDACCEMLGGLMEG
jgi:hypothetical protein